MSLLKRNKDKQLADEQKLAARHALVKKEIDRNVRGAVLQGFIYMSELEIS